MKNIKYLIRTLSFLILILFSTFGLAQSSGYPTVDCNNFYINGIPYRPLVINYSIDYANVNSVCATTPYYASPYWGYSNGATTWAEPPASGMPCMNPMGWTGRPSYQKPGFTEQTIATNKLYSDLSKIKNMGFNTLRVFTSREYHPNAGGFYNQAGSLANDLTVIDALLLAIRNYNFINNENLKVILMLGKSTNCTPSSPSSCSVGEWDDYAGFKTYIETVADRYKNYPEIMAYDLYNEPDQSPWNQYCYLFSTTNDKYKISSWVSDWYYSIKKFDPNHLVTIGLSGSIFTLGWDPNTMPIDFVSLHYYSLTQSVSISNDRIGSYLYFAAKNIKKPWIIGETGYAGSDAPLISDPLIGSEADQKNFAALTLQRSVDCGCKGYSWWQYQDVQWGDWQNYLGLIDQYGLHGNNLEGFDKDIVDATLSPPPPFLGYSTLSSNASACVAPTCYYNWSGGPYVGWSGFVKDETGQIIPNAEIILSANYNTIGVETHTDNSGNFKIYGSGISTFSKIRISAPGYSTIESIVTPTGSTIYTITKINNNGWTKKWTNSQNNYIGSWNINDLDKFYNLDYDGDGQDELLCLQNSGGNNDRATMFYFNVAIADWGTIWSNSNNDWIGSWHLQTVYNDRFVTGDFDGIGGDELLSMQVYGSNDWCTLQNFDAVAGSWNVVHTNSGNDYIGPWKIETTDEFKSGDFNGDGKDDLFCVRKTNGNADLFSILNYSTVTNTWNYMLIGGNPITNYGSDWIGSWKINTIDKYYIGNFDGDALNRDDILFVQSTGGSADWMTLQTLNTTSPVFDPPLWTNSGSNSVSIYPFRSNLIIGNFDEDTNDEIMGFATTSTAKFDFSASTFNQSWGPFGRFSDWSVVTPTTNYRFIKTNKNSPAQLMLFKKAVSPYLVNLYSFNRIADCPTTRAMSSNEIPNIDSKAEDTDFKIFPNPSQNEITIEGGEISKVELFNVQGEKVLEVISKNINIESLSKGVYFVKITDVNQEVHNKKIVKQ